MHPLAPEAGGDAFHSGGRQFASKNDPNYKLIAQWAQGATLAPAARHDRDAPRGRPLVAAIEPTGRPQGPAPTVVIG